MSKLKIGNIRTRRTTALILAVCYLLCLLLGCFIIWLVPFVKNRNALLEDAHEVGSKMLNVWTRDDSMLFGMEHWLYTEDNVLISREASFLHESQTEYVDSVVPQVLEKGSLFRPALFLLNGDVPTKVFGIVIGATVENSSGQTFVSILLRDLPDVSTIMLTFLFLFTLMYLVGVFFTVALFKKEQEVNRMRRDLIANVSHELKTPITSIRAMAEVLHDGMLSDHPTKHTYCGKIMEETDKLEHLVLDILELSKLQSHRAEFKKTVTHADGIIPPVVDRYMMQCGDFGINLDVSALKLGQIPPLYTDVDKLITLMEILMDNAVKFTGPGGTIRFSSQLQPKHAVFCIQDNGPGIRSEDIPRIFERFYKVDTAHNSSGSGLGLAIADEIIKGLDEKLWVDSTFGQGTAFYFTVSYKHPLSAPIDHGPF